MGNHNSGRKPSDKVSVVPRGRLIKPHGMTDDGRKLWDSVVRSLPDQMLGTGDQKPLEDLVRFYEEYRRLFQKWQGEPQNNRLQRAWEGCYDRYLKLSVQFGLTPTARQKLQTTEISNVSGETPLKSLLGRVG